MISPHSSGGGLDGLALKAVEQRVQALSEYLAIYRARLASGMGGRRWRHARVLRSDIQRLKAWWWYLKSVQSGAAWVPLLNRLAAGLAMMMPLRKESRRRRRSARTMRRLSSHSLVLRAYVTLEEDLEGQLLTRRLTAKQFPARVTDTELASIQALLEQASALRRDHLPDARHVAVCCQILRAVMAVRTGLGVPLQMKRVIEP